MEMDTAGGSQPTAETTTKEKKNKPKATKFRQQKLAAWQPILTASTVIPAFWAVGICFIPLGAILYHASNGVKETIIDYTDCKSTSASPEKKCSEILNENPNQKCRCQIDDIELLDFTDASELYFYYFLSNFYQNHRRYVKSRNDQQLLGDLSEVTNCEPFAKNESGVPIVPCGAIANSMFNDTFELIREDTNTRVPFTYEGVAWPVDYERKFKNPSNIDEFAQYAKPPAWPKGIGELDLDHEENNGFHNVDFMVWMRTAALPSFRKLWRRLNTTEEMFKNGLPAGNYTLIIDYKYPVTSFSGSKRFVIATSSWLGGKNSFLGVAYIVVGSLCFVLGIVFLVIHWKYGKSLSEMSAVHGRAP